MWKTVTQFQKFNNKFESYPILFGCVQKLGNLVLSEKFFPTVARGRYDSYKYL